MELYNLCEVACKGVHGISKVDRYVNGYRFKLTDKYGYGSKYVYLHPMGVSMTKSSLGAFVESLDFDEVFMDNLTYVKSMLNTCDFYYLTDDVKAITDSFLHFFMVKGYDIKRYSVSDLFAFYNYLANIVYYAKESDKWGLLNRLMYSYLRLDKELVKTITSEYRFIPNSVLRELESLETLDHYLSEKDMGITYSESYYNNVCNDFKNRLENVLKEASKYKSYDIFDYNWFLKNFENLTTYVTNELVYLKNGNTNLKRRDSFKVLFYFKNKYSLSKNLFLVPKGNALLELKEV